MIEAGNSPRRSGWFWARLLDLGQISADRDHRDARTDQRLTASTNDDRGVSDPVSPTQSDDHPHPIALPEDAFRELASGGGSPDVIRLLWDGEHSRRLIMLLAFLERSRAEPALSAGRVTPVAEAWAALERAEKQDAGVVATLLMHPQVGSWLSYTLRRTLGGARSAAPGYHDFAQIHALALAASAATAQAYTATVPLWSGRAYIPQVGMAHFEGCPEWDLADAGTEDGRIWLRWGDQVIDVPPAAREQPDWWPLRRLSVGEDVRLTVWLDDLDPMRDLADPVPPARLSAAEFRRWSDLLRDAWAILVDHHRPTAKALAAGVTSLVPLPAGDGWSTRSASTGDAFGAIMCSPPPDAVTLSVSLAHEFTHIKLGGLMHMHTMTEGPGDPNLYAPWRDDPRPASGLLQGIYAFFAIADFWRTEPSRFTDVVTDFEYAYARAQTSEALEIALRDGNLTERGRMFAERLGEVMRDWPDDVDERAQVMVRLVADGHRAGWRIRHCLPSTDDVAALARSLDDDWPADATVHPSQVRPDPEMRHWSAARLGLARRHLRVPDRDAEARDQDWGAALTDADVMLFAGQPEKAAAVFLDEIAENPASADAWTGLGLALCAENPGSRAGRVLLSRPEVVMAVHRETRTSHSPIAVADLVGSRLSH
jgi:HEXXH motif-containing protein